MPKPDTTKRFEGRTRALCELYTTEDYRRILRTLEKFRPPCITPEAMIGMVNEALLRAHGWGFISAPDSEGWDREVARALKLIGKEPTPCQD